MRKSNEFLWLKKDDEQQLNIHTHILAPVMQDTRFEKLIRSQHFFFFFNFLNHTFVLQCRPFITLKNVLCIRQGVLILTISTSLEAMRTNKLLQKY
jgi:hypothetical protein